MVYLDDEIEAAPKMTNYKVKKGVVHIKGLLYHHPMLKRYEGKEIEIIEFEDDLRIIGVILPGKISVLAESVLNYPTDSVFSHGENLLELMNVQAKLRKLEYATEQLELACESALLLRGIAGAIVDPLALHGDKEAYRARYKEIEAQIRDAIKAAKELK